MKTFDKNGSWENGFFLYLSQAIRKEKKSVNFFFLTKRIAMGKRNVHYMEKKGKKWPIKNKNKNTHVTKMKF